MHRPHREQLAKLVFLELIMTSSERDVKKIATEMQHLSLKTEQLLERKKLLCVMQELRNRAEFGEAEKGATGQNEIDSIDDALQQMAKNMTELQKCYDSILSAKNNKMPVKEVKFSSSPVIVPIDPAPGSDILFVETPPSEPAPTVILDIEKLPPWPSRTQCPECRQFIVTETYSSVSSVTWLVCIMTALLGGVAGCCLLPFCFDKFKTTTHRCPKCRTSIKIIKKL